MRATAYFMNHLIGALYIYTKGFYRANWITERNLFWASALLDIHGEKDVGAAGFTAFGMPNITAGCFS